MNKQALVAAYIFIITVGGVTNKLAYQIKTEGLPDYGPHNFRKPWFMVLLMFVGMTMSYPVYWFMSAQQQKVAGPPKKQEPWRVYALVFVPAMLDLTGSVLSFTGLVYIGNSTALMLGSTIILFVAVNSYIFLGRRFNNMQMSGMFVVFVAIMIIGKAASLSAEETSSSSSAAEQGLGIFLCILARFVNSIQFVVEEKMLGDTSLEPLQVVGTEGIYGLIVTACVIMPIAASIPGHDVGHVYENTADSVLMLHNWTLDSILFLYLLGLWGLNALGMMVTKHLGGVFRAVSTNLQSLFVWLIDLGLFYGVGTGFGFPVGEAWKGQGSWLQAFGFVVLVSGTLTYAYGNSVQSAAISKLPSRKHSLKAAGSSSQAAGRLASSGGASR
mmetsp:Transcript_41900/g.99769  ORF Transcript_41900/g.99769 Transcript_41900/m.99769 type:complete len:385 (+) Transcript_41900:76-1230(+)